MQNGLQQRISQALIERLILRINEMCIRDRSKANIENVKNITGVVGCVNKGGQFQIVIGTQVADVYNELIQIAHIQTDGEEKKEKKNPVSYTHLDVYKRQVWRRSSSAKPYLAKADWRII